MRYIIGFIIMLFAISTKTKAIKYYYDINSQAEVDSVASHMGMLNQRVYAVYLENDTTLSLSEQINDITILGQNADTLYLHMYDTRVTSISGLVQNCLIKTFTSRNNLLLSDLDGLLDSELSSFTIERTPLSGALNFTTTSKYLDFEVINCDQVTSIEVIAPNVVERSNPNHVNSFVVEKNDSLHYISWVSENNRRLKFNIEENRQLDSVYIDPGTMAIGYNDQGERGGFVFNENLRVIDGFSNGQDTLASFGMKYNYNLTDFCALKNPVENGLAHLYNLIGSYDTASYFQISQNSTGINTLEELRAYDCISTGFEELRKNEVVVYPNPANDRVFIKGINNATPYEFYSLTGEVVKTGTLQANGVIDVNQFSSGVYLLKIGEQTEKVIVQ
ncbi:MAG: T9SS type A sorting domain-containing protein [Salibacter sp.]|uniref:T9SS type A sorting domain-containing protein n=1 Tax=Salibacter sp. TaxID=2010995 RepID=UPI00287039C2|nr:T9SS type A sorting domain-containing protein [Salibacter sp.]MDR9397598.1 T9SS type A sorting domain-containing protein [Salibacter sp.]